MSLLCLVVDEGEPCAGPLRFRYLPEGGAVEIPAAPAQLPEAHERTLEQQIEFIGELAKRQFPDDESGQLNYRLERITAKLREMSHRVSRLEVREMK